MIKCYLTLLDPDSGLHHQNQVIYSMCHCGYIPKILTKCIHKVSILFFAKWTNAGCQKQNLLVRGDKFVYIHPHILTNLVLLNGKY